MNKTYRNVAVAAGGILLAAVAGSLVRRSRTGASGDVIAQVLTANLTPEDVYARLMQEPSTFNRALDMEGDVVLDFSDDLRVIEWTVPGRPSLDGRLALIEAPGGRGTELHIAMHGEKYEIKDIVRHIKSLLETGEIPTGARYQ